MSIGFLAGGHDWPPQQHTTKKQRIKELEASEECLVKEGEKMWKEIVRLRTAIEEALESFDTVTRDEDGYQILRDALKGAAL